MKRFFKNTEILSSIIIFAILISLKQEFCFSEILEQNLNAINYDFSHFKNGYKFTGQFFIKKDPTCLLNICYDFKHLKTLLKGIASVNLIREGKDWYEVVYIYRCILGKITSTFKKTLQRNNNKVIFEMTHFKQKVLLTPIILFCEGYYKITPQNGGCLVEYSQKCTLEDKGINDLYILLAKNEVVQFILNLKKYAENTCH